MARNIKINVKPLAHIININETKRNQLEKVQDITINLTSDDGCDVTLELYENHIARYIIEGTRSKMTVTYDTYNFNICRKPYGKKPFDSIKTHCNISDILNYFK